MKRLITILAIAAIFTSCTKNELPYRHNPLPPSQGAIPVTIQLSDVCGRSGEHFTISNYEMARLEKVYGINENTQVSDTCIWIEVNIITDNWDYRYPAKKVFKGF